MRSRDFPAGVSAFWLGGVKELWLLAALSAGLGGFSTRDGGTGLLGSAD